MSARLRSPVTVLGGWSSGLTSTARSGDTVYGSRLLLGPEMIQALPLSQPRCTKASSFSSESARGDHRQPRARIDQVATTF